MTEPAYPAARIAARKIHPCYARRAGCGGPGAELLPDIDVMEAMLNVAFWASLRREEIYTPRVSLAFVAPSHLDSPLTFERPVELASRPLTRLGPAVERPGIHLCVWPGEKGLRVWGVSRKLPPLCFVIEVVAPGILVIKRSRGDESGKFVNVAVLEGEEVKIIDEQAGGSTDRPELLTSLLGLETQREPAGSVNVLVRLAVSMREHGRGGSLLVIPSDSTVWRESVLQPIAYAVHPPFRALVDLMREDEAERASRKWQETLQRLVDGVAGLTAVDGATIISRNFDLLAFGAKIVRREGWQQVERVIVTQPIEGSVAEVAEPGQLGGTRHFSAAQFAHDQRDSAALVASQDGRFTVFGWSERESMVHAHRIEALLL